MVSSEGVGICIFGSSFGNPKRTYLRLAVIRITSERVMGLGFRPRRKSSEGLADLTVWMHNLYAKNMPIWAAVECRTPLRGEVE